MRLLLVEDDAMLADGMRRAFEQAGYSVDLARAGDDAAAALASQNYSAVLLDLSLPRMDGMDVLRTIRGRRDRTPVIVVTARDGSKQRIEGLDAGADDYVTKPFDLDELLARVRASIRRGEGRPNEILSAQNVRYDLIARAAFKDDVPVTLTPKEHKILIKLLGRVGAFVSKDELENVLYAEGGDAESNTIEVTIYALRRKLGANFIVTARGLGYMIAK